MSNEQLLTCVNGFLWLEFQAHLLDICEKSESTWSRLNVTLVIDRSMYRHLLACNDEIPECDTFCSGHYHAPVYGFRLTLIGMVMGGQFFPMHCAISSKAHKELDVAKTLLAHFKQQLDLLKTTQPLDFPNLFVSVDSGLCHPDLFTAQEEITVISVPKKSWIFEIDGQTMNLNAHIDRFLEEEQTSRSPVFPLRKRAVGNTLGRRWFQRTSIEQFFRFSKHLLCIQSSTSTNAAQFERKVALHFLKVRVCQAFTLFCRTHLPLCHTWSFEKIRRHAIDDQVDQTYLEQLFFDYDHLLHSMNELTA